MKVLIVEDELLTAEAMRSIIDACDRHQVIGIAEDLPSALAAAQVGGIDLALVDIHLARHTSGFAVAAELKKVGIPSVFVTGTAPPFDMFEIALGCLTKPFSGDDLLQLLDSIEPILRGTRSTPPTFSDNARIYVGRKEG